MSTHQETDKHSAQVHLGRKEEREPGIREPITESMLVKHGLEHFALQPIVCME